MADKTKLPPEAEGILKDVKKREPTPELTNDVVVNLAGLTPLQFAQQLGLVAKRHKVPVRLLERAVADARIEKEAENLLQPHWAETPADNPVDASQLFADIEARILQHVAMPKDLALVIALWIGQSWVHEHGTYSPILGVTSSDPNCGKSTLMGVISFLARRALLTVSPSGAVLYRSIEKWGPSFVIDEADNLFVENHDLWQVINSGWTRGQGVMRCDPDTHEPRLFSTFCPKAIALKGKKMPEQMLSRTIFIQLKRRLRSERIRHFRHLDDDDFARMRSQLARWAEDNGEALGLARPIAPEGFINRPASNWEMMLAIADSLGSGVGKRARKVAVDLANAVDVASMGANLLRDIKTMFDASTLDYITTKAMIENLKDDPEKPWAEWSHGRPITDKGVAGLLHGYEIVSGCVGPKGSTAKGYRKADFLDAWARYLSPTGAEKGEAPSEPDFLPSTRRPDCNHSGKAEKSAVDQGVGRRQKIDGFSNNINAVDGSTGEIRGLAASSFSSSPPSAQSNTAKSQISTERQQTSHREPTDDARRCAHCGLSTPVPNQASIDGLLVYLHRGCERAYRAGLDQPKTGHRSGSRHSTGGHVRLQRENDQLREKLDRLLDGLD